MPTPLEGGPHNITQEDPRPNAEMRNFVASLRQATVSVRDFSAGTKAAVMGGRRFETTGFGALNYVAGQIGSKSGSSFLERRLDWALFGAGTSGASVLGQSLMVGLNAGDISYNTRTGLHVGQTAQDAVKYNAGKAVFQKTGADPFGVAAIMGGEQSTADVTGRVARYGGNVTPSWRTWVMQVKTAESNREIYERQQVNKLAAAMYGGTYQSSSMPTGSKSNDDKLLEVLQLIQGAITQIKVDFANWLSGGHGGTGH